MRRILRTCQGILRKCQDLHSNCIPCPVMMNRHAATDNRRNLPFEFIKVMNPCISTSRRSGNKDSVCLESLRTWDFA